MYSHQEPRAFSDDRKKELWLKNLIWCILTGTGLILIGWQMKIVQRFQRGNFLEKNSFRFCVIMFFAFISVAIYLVVSTKNLAPGQDRAHTMQRDYPIAAYSMTALALILIVGSFILFTDLVGALGILLFFCFWGFLINFIFVLAY